MTPIAPHMSAYLSEYLVGQRAASEHTLDTYACAFKLLFEFASQRLKARPSDLKLEQIDAPRVVACLEHLETTRGKTPSTRNNRLAAIKAFFRFLEHRLPAAMEQIRRVLAIPTKKTDTRLVPYLSSQEMDALLDAPDPSTWAGRRDRAMFVLFLIAGLRVSELVGLRMDDLTHHSCQRQGPQRTHPPSDRRSRLRSPRLARGPRRYVRARDLRQHSQSAAQPMGSPTHPQETHRHRIRSVSVA